MNATTHFQMMGTSIASSVISSTLVTSGCNQPTGPANYQKYARRLTKIELKALMRPSLDGDAASPRAQRGDAQSSGDGAR